MAIKTFHKGDIVSFRVDETVQYPTYQTHPVFKSNYLTYVQVDDENYVHVTNLHGEFVEVADNTLVGFKVGDKTVGIQDKSPYRIIYTVLLIKNDQYCVEANNGIEKWMLVYDKKTFHKEHILLKEKE